MRYVNCETVLFINWLVDCEKVTEMMGESLVESRRVIRAAIADGQEFEDEDGDTIVILDVDSDQEIDRIDWHEAHHVAALAACLESLADSELEPEHDPGSLLDQVKVVFLESVDFETAAELIHERQLDLAVAQYRRLSAA